MKNRMIHDLHGNEYSLGDYQISGLFPDKSKYENRKMVLTRDTNTNTQFILIIHGEKHNKYVYIFYENSVYIYGNMIKTGYNKTGDMRNGKES